MKRSEVEPWVGIVVAVVLGSLKGPVAGGATLVGELAKHAAKRWACDPGQEQLEREVREAITRWAVGEQLSPEVVRLGLELAAELIAAAGPDRFGIAQANYAAAPIAAGVVATGRAKEPLFWGREPHYAVAEQTIACTYAAVMAKLRADEAGMVALMEVATTLVAEVAAVRAAVAGRASKFEVMTYLRVRCQDWDRSVLDLDGRAPSSVERTLRLDRDGARVTEAEALAGQRGLVVLGGPGSGKTWLARRYARAAAEQALAELRAGADLETVELPVLTTWDRWARTAGSPKEAAVTASFAAQLGPGDVGDADMVARLQRTLNDHPRVLAVLDSLDEADDAHAPQRLAGILSTSWRIVITSRPAAWQPLQPTVTRPAGDHHGGPVQVASVADLTYPDDVEAFIAEWFTDAPATGQALRVQLERRAELRRNAVVPLLLTFYCLLAQDQPRRGLPPRRRELYTALTRRLLRGPWTNTPTRPPVDLATCEQELKRYAWAAVRDAHTANGLGAWADTFTPPWPPAAGEVAWALSHVVPTVDVDAEGNRSCRFVHRTLLEHFVAEHIATLEVPAAADALLPHLWFDPDWEVAAPAAIAAHNRTHPGLLLEHLLHILPSPRPEPTPPWAKVADAQIDTLILRVAAESAPDDWDDQHQHLIHDTRRRTACTLPDLVGAAAHWADSNPDIRTTLVAALPTADRDTVLDLVAGLVQLEPTDADRAGARTVLLAALPTADPYDVPSLVAGLLQLEPTDADRAGARTAVLAALPTADPYDVPSLVAELLQLEPTDADRAGARTVLLAELLTIHSFLVPLLVAGLVQLEVTDADRSQACAALVAALPTADPFAVPSLVTGMLQLEVTDAEWAQVRTAILAALPTTDPYTVPDLVAELLQLEPTDADRAQARTTILAALPTAAPETASFLVAGLVQLVVTDADRVQVRTAILGVLAALPTAAPSLVAGLVQLEPTDADRAQVRTAILAALPTTDPCTVPDLVAGLVQLEPTDADRAGARTAILAALPTAAPFAVPSLVAGLVQLEPTDADRAGAHTAILAALPTAAPSTVPSLVAGLVQLEPTDADRDQARTTLLAALPTAAPSTVAGLVAGLVQLEPTDADRAGARTAILAALPTAAPSTVPSLVAELADLVVTDADRAQARTALLAALPTADPAIVPDLVMLIRRFSITQTWLEWLRMDAAGATD